MEPFTAVVTTGIYCRARLRRPAAAPQHPAVHVRSRRRSRRLPPVPAVPARPRTGTGLDRRARARVPRAAPASPTARSTSETEDELAAQLGVSARHLRRLFDDARRRDTERSGALTAGALRRAASSTTPTCSIAGVGYAAGFNSVRQMNRVMKEVFRFTPDELRARRRKPDRLVADGGLELRVRYRPPLAWDAMLAFLAPRAIPGVEAVDLDAGVYRRTVELGGRRGRDRGVERTRPRSAAPARCTSPTFDGLVHLVAQCPPAVRPRRRSRRHRPRARARPHPRARSCALAAACGSRARSIRSRSASAPCSASRSRSAARPASRAGSSTSYGAPVPGIDPLGLTHLFPTAATLAKADLVDVGLTGARRAALAGFAARGRDRRARLRAGPRARRAVRELRRCPGSATGPRSTSRCGPRASATRSRPLTWACARRSAPRPTPRPRRMPSRWRRRGDRGGRTAPCTSGRPCRRSEPVAEARPDAPISSVCPGQSRYSSLRSVRIPVLLRTGSGRDFEISRNETGTPERPPIQSRPNFPSQKIPSVVPKCWGTTSPGTRRLIRVLALSARPADSEVQLERRPPPSTRK